eukprot:scaffold8114_cov112-Isochrysis_galbana.AAC.5
MKLGGLSLLYNMHTPKRQVSLSPQCLFGTVGCSLLLGPPAAPSAAIGNIAPAGHASNGFPGASKAEIVRFSAGTRPTLASHITSLTSGSYTLWIGCACSLLNRCFLGLPSVWLCSDRDRPAAAAAFCKPSASRRCFPPSKLKPICPSDTGSPLLGDTQPGVVISIGPHPRAGGPTKPSVLPHGPLDRPATAAGAAVAHGIATSVQLSRALERVPCRGGLGPAGAGFGVLGRRERRGQGGRGGCAL